MIELGRLPSQHLPKRLKSQKDLIGLPCRWIHPPSFQWWGETIVLLLDVISSLLARAKYGISSHRVIVIEGMVLLLRFEGEP